MKSVKNLLLVALCVLTFGAINVDAYTIKESVDPADNLTVIEEGTTIVGITKFTPDQVLTSGRVSIASQNYTLYMTEHRFDSCYMMESEEEFEACYEENYEITPPGILYYLMGTWFVIDEDNNATAVTDAATIELFNTQYLFYINNVMKVMNFQYELELEEGYSIEYFTSSFGDNFKEELLNSSFKYENGYLTVPSLATFAHLVIVDEEGNYVGTYASYYVDVEHIYLIPISTTNGSIVATPETEGTVVGNTITFGGEIPWYDSSESGRDAGNRVGISIVPGQGADTSSVEIIVDGFGYDGTTEEAHFEWSEDYHTPYETFEWFPRVTEAGETGTIEVIWNEAYSQVFTIKIADDATLEAAPAGEIAWDEKIGNVVDKDFYVDQVGDTITFGGSVEDKASTVAWYRADQIAAGLVAGNRVGVTIKAPEYYVENNLLEGVTLVITDNEYPDNIGTGITNADGTFNYYPLFTEAGQTVTVKAIWEPGNEQTFTINLAEGTVLETEKSYGTIVAQPANPEMVTVAETDPYSSITFDGTIPYYSAAKVDEGRTMGHRVGVKIIPDQAYIDRHNDAEDDYNLGDVDVVITASDKQAQTYKWSQDVSGSELELDYWPLMSETYEGETTITVTWEKDEEGNALVVQTFTVKLAETAVYENIYGEMKINTDDNGYAPTSVLGETATEITGELKYYSADGDRDKNGFRFGVQITPSEYYADKLDDVYVYIVDGERDGITPIKWAKGAYTTGDTTFNYWPVVDINNPVVSTIRVVWETDAEGKAVVEQTFKVDPTNAKYNVLGTLEQLDETPAKVEGNVMTITGEIPYYAADDSVERELGHRVGLAIVPSQYYIDLAEAGEFDFADVEVEIHASDKQKDSEIYYSWTDDEEGSEYTFDYWPLMSEDYEGKTTITVTWEPGVTQTFEVVLGEGASYESLLGTIAVNTDDENRKPEASVVDADGNVTISGNVYYYPETTENGAEGYRVGLQITPGKYFANNDTAREAAKVYIWNVGAEFDTANEYQWNKGAYTDANGTDNSTFNYWPLVEEGVEFAKNIRVVWEDGLEQGFTVTLGDVTFENIYGTMMHNEDDTTEALLDATGNTLVVNGNVTYYEKDASKDRNDGAFRTGVAITVSDYFKKTLTTQELDAVEVVIKDLNETNTYDWVDGAFDTATGGEDTFNYWPALTPGQKGIIEITVKWDATNADHDQTFYIDLDNATFNLNGTIDSQVANPETLISNVTDDSTIKFTGVIPYYAESADAEDSTPNAQARGEGYRVGVKITPHQYYLDRNGTDYSLDNAVIVLTSADREGDQLTWADDDSGSNSTLDFWPLIDETTDVATVRVYWDAKNLAVYQDFTIDATGATLEDISGDIEVIGVKNGRGPVENTPSEDGNTVTITGEIPYFTAEEVAADGGQGTGNRIGLQITASEYFKNYLGDNIDAVSVKITKPDGSEMTPTWADGGYFTDTVEGEFYYWPEIVADSEGSIAGTYKIEVMWDANNADHNDTFYVVISDEASLEAAPATN